MSRFKLGNAVYKLTNGKVEGPFTIVTDRTPPGSSGGPYVLSDKSLVLEANLFTSEAEAQARASRSSGRLRSVPPPGAKPPPRA
jgi:hypothetical protein